MDYPINPIPEKHEPPPFKDSYYIKEHGDFVKDWKWHNENGEWLFCTARYELQDPDRKNKKIKSILPFHYNKKWKSNQPIKNNRPLYDLHKIIETDKLILLVEGEKCRDTAGEIFPNEFLSTTWSGGTGAIKKTDFSPIKNRVVYYWYDNDDPGYKTIEYLRTVLNNLILVIPPNDKPKGWDITDAYEEDKWTINDIYIFIMQFKEIEKEKEAKKQKFIEDMEYPFQLLGYNDGYMYFMPNETGQIFKVRQGSLKNSDLQALAPLEFWRIYYGQETRRGVVINWMDAIDAVIRECYLQGPYDKNKLRGRGVWREKDGIVIHTGKYIIKNKQKIEIKEYKRNGYIYERLPEIELNIENEKLDPELLKRIISCFRKLSVENSLQLNFLIGWCVLGFMCGALEWRPHLWITGSSNTGKSTIMQLIVKRILGEFKLSLLGNSTAAGMMQYQRNDSLAITFDEAEPSADNQNIIKAILDVARAGSSSSDDKLLKGTADQNGRVYVTNFSFCLASVNTLLMQTSDSRRFSVVNMTKNLKHDWDKLKQEIIEVFSPENCSKIRSHIYNNFDIVEKNIEMFRNVSGTCLKDMGAGDQVGTLLAGAASLIDMKIYDYETCTKICEKYLKDYEIHENNIPDEIECLRKLLTSKIRWTGHNDRTEETTLLNLINQAAGNNENMVPDDKARRELYKYGVNYSYKKKKVFIACSYEWLKNILNNTPWRDCYYKILKRLKFVEKKTPVTGFGSYYNGRAIAIPEKFVFRLSDDKIFMEAGF